MSTTKISVHDDENFVGYFQFVKLDSDDDPAERTISRSIVISKQEIKIMDKSLSMGRVTLNLDFDSDGEIVAIEMLN